MATLQDLEDIKREWLAIFDAIRDGLIVVKSDHVIQKVNRAVSGSSHPKALIGKRCFESFAQRTSPCEGCTLLGAAKDFETTIKGRSFRVSVQEHKNVRIHIYHDSTEAKRMRQQLVLADKLQSLGMLAGGVAHELNNPLGGIAVFAEMLVRELPPDSSSREDAMEIRRAVDRCKNIIDQLLHFARTKPVVTKESVDLADLLRQADRLVRLGIPGNLISLEITGNATVHTSAARLLQVFVNLLTNSFQAIGECEGHVKVSLTSQKDGVLMSFGDSGPGIDPAIAQNVFDPFFTTKDPGVGTGLGLSVTHSIIQELGGRIWLEDSVFYIQVNH